MTSKSKLTADEPDGNIPAPYRAEEPKPLLDAHVAQRAEGDIILDNRKELVTCLAPCAPVAVAHFRLQRGGINADESEVILSKITGKDKATALLELLAQKAKGLDMLIDYLEEQNHNHVAALLRGQRR